MPEVTFNMTDQQRVFDARPDRIDMRDLDYRPPLVNLPDAWPDAETLERYLPAYRRSEMLLNQFDEGACTGFGLAAVINFLKWKRWMESGGKGAPPARVSPRMLYQNAKLYDEWNGEDYDGSSCRGAIKGLHKHGVCSEDHWPYLVNKKPAPPKADWAINAIETPLGAYYRISTKWLVAMQAALRETHAIYVSADTHDGWNLGKCKSLQAATIRPASKKSARGGHAFALVGYNADGFIVQNSWGAGWGYLGFALLPYGDWVANGYDAWVLALGARIAVASSPISKAAGALAELARVPDLTRGPPSVRGPAGSSAALASKLQPWTTDEAVRHILVIGHEGKVERQMVAARDGAEEIGLVMDHLEAQLKKGVRRIALYAHGGLNSQDAGFKRARRMGPWFHANKIHPVFLVWRTGILECFADMATIAAKRLFQVEDKAELAAGWFDRIVDAMKEKVDKSFEVVARDVIIKAAWDNMKERAELAAEEKGATCQMAQRLSAILAKYGDAELHLLGHSAGAILHGHFLAPLAAGGIKAKTCHLWAPACTVDFALDRFGKAFDAGVLRAEATYVGRLTDENERKDACAGPLYSKSLLYLISRALEKRHKTPVLGQDIARKASRAQAVRDNIFNAEGLATLKEWDKIAANMRFDDPVGSQDVPTRIEDGRIKTESANHGSFDNNLAAVDLALARIQGKSGKKPEVPVTDLTGF